ncbi:MAG: hypothetical protein JNG90_10030 [Planctomycetaceae bacterium]|nr:hypothetical protein [Planctomycetaceae bacterium]
MKMLRSLNRRISTEKFDVASGRITSFGGAILVLVLGMFNLASLPLTEVEVFFGVLLVLAVTMQGVIIGLLAGNQACKP